MATMKSYTDLEQSKKLAEILPLETVDMMYHSVESEYGSGAFVATSKVITNGFENDDFYIDDIPCWSLAALLDFLKDKIIFGGNSPEGWFCCYTIKNPTKVLTIYGDSLVDACYELVLGLHEQNLF